MQWLKSAGVAQFALLLGLAILSGVSEVRLTPAQGWVWWCLCAAMILGLLCTMLALNRMTRATTALRLVFAALGLSPLALIAVFGGLRVILHHASSHEGAMTVTIERTQDTHRKRTCRPRATIEEFSFLTNDLCLSQEQFRALFPGQQVTVVGKVSRFGVTPQRLILSRSRIEEPMARNEQRMDFLISTVIVMLVGVLIGWGGLQWMGRGRR